MDYKKILDFRNENIGFGKNVGIFISHISEDFAKGEMEINSSHLNQLGIVHGGALYTLADTVAGSAAASCGNKFVTINSTFNYLEAGENTEKIYAKARVVRGGRTIYVIDVELTDDYGKLLCTGTFTFFNLQQKLDIVD